jgi:hypothetical protein
VDRGNRRGGGRGFTLPTASVVAGGFHSCAGRSNNQTMCWGRNDNGQLGDGTLTRRLTPVAVNGA